MTNKEFIDNNTRFKFISDSIVYIIDGESFHGSTCLSIKVEDIDKEIHVIDMVVYAYSSDELKKRLDKIITDKRDKIINKIIND